jgi:hypothetical protein
VNLLALLVVLQHQIHRLTTKTPQSLLVRFRYPKQHSGLLNEKILQTTQFLPNYDKPDYNEKILNQTSNLSLDCEEFGRAYN